MLAAGIGGYLIANNGGGEKAETVAVMPAHTGIGGTLEVGENSSTLKLHGLPQLTGSEVYQAWIAKGSSLKPSSNFIPDSNGTAETGVDGHLTNGDEGDGHPRAPPGPDGADTAGAAERHSSVAGP